MPRIALPNGWQPRAYQLPLWNFLEKGGRRAVAVWHRRAGPIKMMCYYIGLR